MCRNFEREFIQYVKEKTRIGHLAENIKAVRERVVEKLRNIH